jgi:hypothetical protein
MKQQHAPEGAQPGGGGYPQFHRIDRVSRALLTIDRYAAPEVTTTWSGGATFSSQILAKFHRSSTQLQEEETRGTTREVGSEEEIVAGTRGATSCHKHRKLGEARTIWIVALVHVTMQPLMAPWHLGVADSWANWPHAEDAPYSYIPGPGPDRVLVLGCHTPAAFGVLTHELGLVGDLSRYVHRSRVSRVTNRKLSRF